LDASEQATHPRPDWPISRDTPGLVRALSGDLHGATEGLEFVVNALHGGASHNGRHEKLGVEVDIQQQRTWFEVP
jgi:hypothetical protein